MALITQTDYVSGTRPTPIPEQAGEVVAVRGKVTLSANPTANDTTAHVILPANCVPVDFVLDSDDIDTNGAPTIAISVGVLNAAKTDIDTSSSSGGAAWATGLTTAQASGASRPTTKTLWRVTPTTADRVVGLKYTTASATFASGEIGFTLFYRAAHFAG